MPSRSSLFSIAIGLFLSTFGLSACASTATQRVDLDPQVVEAEQHYQRQLVVQRTLDQQQRLDNVAFPIFEAAVPLCQEDVAPRAGFRIANRHDFEDEWARAAEDAIGLGDTIHITGVTATSPADRSALRPGDRIVALNGEPVPVGEDATDEVSNRLTELQQSEASNVTLTIWRDNALHKVRIKLSDVCNYPARVVHNSSLNALTDGEQIYVTTSMMRFVDDYELATIVAHELAHNAMDHIDKQQQNTIFGAILGAIADVALAAAGYNTGGAFTTEGAKLGQISHSQDFEREADYVGLYAMALASIPLDSAPRFWRQMAQENPDRIGFAYTHPTSAERFVRMQRVIEEIHFKQANDLALRPEMKDAEENRELERSLAQRGEQGGEAGQRDAEVDKAFERDEPEGMMGLAQEPNPDTPDTDEAQPQKGAEGEHGVEVIKGPAQVQAIPDTLVIHYSEYTSPWLNRRQFRRDRKICKDVVKEKIRQQPIVTQEDYEERVRQCLSGKGWKLVVRN